MPTLFPPYNPVSLPTPQPEREVQFDTTFEFDFENGEFKLTPGNEIKIVSGVEAVIQWIRKTLFTERYQYPIYHGWYGSEIPGIIGKLPATVAAAEIERMIKECLLVDDRIRDIGNFVHEIKTDYIITTFEVLCFNDHLVNLSTKTEVA